MQSTGIQMLRSLVIGKNSSHVVNFASEPWNDAHDAPEFSETTRHSGKYAEKADGPFLSAQQKIRSKGSQKEYRKLEDIYWKQAHRGKGNRGPHIRVVGPSSGLSDRNRYWHEGHSDGLG
jgi:hypothetical protein